MTHQFWSISLAIFGLSLNVINKFRIFQQLLWSYPVHLSHDTDTTHTLCLLSLSWHWPSQILKSVYTCIFGQKIQITLIWTHTLHSSPIFFSKAAYILAVIFPDKFWQSYSNISHRLNVWFLLIKLLIVVQLLPIHFLVYSRVSNILLGPTIAKILLMNNWFKFVTIK